jgi:hypothetical protein
MLILDLECQNPNCMFNAFALFICILEIPGYISYLAVTVEGNTPNPLDRKMPSLLLAAGLSPYSSFKITKLSAWVCWSMSRTVLHLGSESLLFCAKLLLVFVHGGLRVAQSQQGFLNLLELLFQGHGAVRHGGRDGSESDTKLSRSG